jgi:hypothetical protein
MADYRALHAYLSTEAHERWHVFAEEQGVSMTALLETMGVELPVGDDDLRPEWQSRVRAARKIDAQRRRRGGAGG